MLTDKLWPVQAAHAALSSWERSSPNGYASRLPMAALEFLRLIGSDADVGVSVRSPERNSPSRMPISGRLFEQPTLKVLPSMRIFLSARRLEIPLGAGKSSFVKHFARRAVPLSRSSSPPCSCRPSCCSRDRRALCSSTAVLAWCSPGKRSTLIAHQTTRPALAPDALSPDLCILAAVRCTKSARALADLLRRSLRRARARHRACDGCSSWLVTHLV